MAPTRAAAAAAALLLLVAIAAAVRPATAVPRQQFVNFLDDQVLTEDYENAMSEAQDLGTTAPVHLFDEYYDAVIVSENGFLVLGTGGAGFDPYLGFDSYAPVPLPMSAHGLVAPFWTDFDTALGEQDGVPEGENWVWYGFRERGTDDYLWVVDTVLAPVLGGLHFRPPRIFVATWDTVRGQYAPETLSNTFQVILASDGEVSFAVFQYLDGGIQLSTGTTMTGEGGELPTVVGFDEGRRLGGAAYVHPLTQPGAPNYAGGSLHALATTSNVGVPGRFIYRLDTAVRGAGDAGCNDLIVGGDFASVGGAAAGGVARYNCDADAWEPLGEGFNGPVHAVRAYRGRIYAGGAFTASATAGTPLPYFAVWDGQAWAPVDGVGLTGTVYALEVYHGLLYVGGFYNATLPSAVPNEWVSAMNLVAWDGRHWQYGAGSTDGPVYALALGPESLMVGGSFNMAGGVKPSTNFAMYRAGAGWLSQVFYGAMGPVTAVAYAADSDAVCLGGKFLYAYDGVMHMAGGLACWYQDMWRVHGVSSQDEVAVNAIVSLGDEIEPGLVIVGGQLVQPDPPGGHVYLGAFELTGSQPAEPAAVNGPVTALLPYHGKMYIFGTFTTAGSLEAPGVATLTLNEEEWGVPAGAAIAGGAVRAACAGQVVHRPAPALADLYVGGNFTGAGGLPARHAARWGAHGGNPNNGVSWAALDAGLPTVVVRAFGEFDGQLVASAYAGSPYGQAQEALYGTVLLWNAAEGAWQGTGWPETYKAYTLAEYDGALYAAGEFYGYADNLGGDSGYGGHAARRRRQQQQGLTMLSEHVAVWDGTGWDLVVGGPDSHVNVMTVYNDLLVVAGGFGWLGDYEVWSPLVATWNGTDWAPLAEDGPSGYEVKALLVVGNTLYIGGDFQSYYQDAAYYNVIAWDGTAWSRPGNGLDPYVYALAWFQNTVVAAVYYYGDGWSLRKYNATVDAWQPMGPSFDDSVDTLAVVNEWLYAGGRFTTVGAVTAGRVARFDGAHWEAVGAPGTGANDEVYALAQLGDDVVIGGAFTKVRYTLLDRVARWPLDGSATAEVPLRKVGSELGGGNVRTLAWFNGMVLAGGDMTCANYYYGQYLCRYVNGAWAPVPNVGSGAVNVLLVAGRRLYMGGAFLYPRRYFAYFDADYGDWTAPYYVPDGPVHALLEDKDGNIYVGGNFYDLYADGGGLSRRAEVPLEPELYFRGAMMYNVSANDWTALGRGIDGVVNALAAVDGDVWAGGEFWTAGTETVERMHLARWDGTEWSPVPSGGLHHDGVAALAVVDGTVYATVLIDHPLTATRSWALQRLNWTAFEWTILNAGTMGTASRLTAFADALLVGGSYKTIGGVRAHHLASWNGAAWHGVGPVPLAAAPLGGVPVGFAALASHNGKLFAGGAMEVEQMGRVGYVAAWTGDHWEALAGRIDNGQVFALAEYNGLLFVGGDFTTVTTAANETVSVDGLVAWDDALGDFVPLGDGGIARKRARGGLVVQALAAFQGRLYVGGSFSAIGTLEEVANVATWDGAAWGTLAGFDPNNEVYAFAVDADADALYIGGCFTNTPTPVVRWDGETWTAVALPLATYYMEGCVRALQLYQGELYAGGDLWLSQNGTSMTDLVRWDDTLGWTALPPYRRSSTSLGTVVALGVFNNLLYAAGDFYSTTAGELDEYLLAYSKTSGWVRPMPSHIDALVNTLAVHQNQLFVGGEFAVVGATPADGGAVLTHDQLVYLAGGFTGAVWSAIAPPNTALNLELPPPTAPPTTPPPPTTPAPTPEPTTPAPLVCPALELDSAIFPATPAGAAGIQVTGTCRATFAGTPSIVCQPDGTWSTAMTLCDRTSLPR